MYCFKTSRETENVLNSKFRGENKNITFQNLELNRNKGQNPIFSKQIYIYELSTQRNFR